MTKTEWREMKLGTHFVLAKGGGRIWRVVGIWNTRRALRARPLDGNRAYFFRIMDCGKYNQTGEITLTRSEFKALKIGDIVQHIGGSGHLFTVKQPWRKDKPLLVSDPMNGVHTIRAADCGMYRVVQKEAMAFDVVV